MDPIATIIDMITFRVKGQGFVMTSADLREWACSGGFIPSEADVRAEMHKRGELYTYERARHAEQIIAMLRG